MGSHMTSYDILHQGGRQSLMYSWAAAAVSGETTVSSRYVTRQLGTDLRRVLQVISPQDVLAKRVAGPGSPEVSRVEIWCHIWNTTKLPQCHAICKTSALCKSTPTSGSSQAEVNK